MKILKHPLDKILDDIPGRSAESIPRNRGITLCVRILLTRYSFWGISCSMKVKTSITLSEDLLKAIDEYTGEYKNRSEFIEGAVRAFIIQLIRRQQDARDLEIINQRADYLNQEAGDVLTYQVDL